jgi:hypothetical protein
VGDRGHGHGVFQIDDRWHAFASTPSAMDPAKNADYAAGMLSGLLKRYGGNVREALSAYNAGSPTATGTTTDWGDGKPIGYADSVLKHMASLGGSGSGRLPSVASSAMAALGTTASSSAALAHFTSTMQSLTAMASSAPVAQTGSHRTATRSWAHDNHITDQMRNDQASADSMSAALVGATGGDGLFED